MSTAASPATPPAPTMNIAVNAAVTTAAPVKKEKPILLVDGVDPFQSKEYLDNPPKPPHSTSRFPLYSTWMAKTLYIEHIAEQFACYGILAYGWTKYIQSVGQTRAAERYIVETDLAKRRALLPAMGLGSIAMRVPGRELNALWVKRRMAGYMPVLMCGMIYMRNLIRRGREEDYWGSTKRQLARDALNNGKTADETVELLRDFMEERRSGQKSEQLYAWYDELAAIKRKQKEAAEAGQKKPWWKSLF